MNEDRFKEPNSIDEEPRFSEAFRGIGGDDEKLTISLTAFYDTWDYCCSEQKMTKELKEEMLKFIDEAFVLLRKIKKIVKAESCDED